MKTLTLSQLEIFSGGDKIDGFCIGFGAAAAAYQVGVWANIWNPAGQTAAVVGGIIGVGCAVYAMR